MLEDGTQAVSRRKGRAAFTPSRAQFLREPVRSLLDRLPSLLPEVPNESAADEQVVLTARVGAEVQIGSAGPKITKFATYAEMAEQRDIESATNLKDSGCTRLLGLELHRTSVEVAESAANTDPGGHGSAREKVDACRGRHEEGRKARSDGIGVRVHVLVDVPEHGNLKRQGQELPAHDLAGDVPFGGKTIAETQEIIRGGARRYDLIADEGSPNDAGELVLLRFRVSDEDAD
jgi:hypothetical protein